MESTVIVFAVLAIGAFVIFIYSRNMINNNHNEFGSINPIDSISFDGCMGFRLGDSREYVMSRILHLNLINEEEKQTIESMRILRVNLPISTSSGLFNNIDTVSFHFNRMNSLSGVLIHLTDKEIDKGKLIQVLYGKLNTILGSRGIPFEKAVYWKYRDIVVCFEKGDDFYLAVNKKYDN